MTNDSGRGLFITFEGTEGVGKSTNLKAATEYLTDKGVSHIVTREPGGTPLAEEIRELLLSSREEPVHDMTELLLMFAARSQHLNQLILPHLEQGTWVLCDRFTDATYAYQGGGRQMSEAPVAALEQLVQGDFRPDRVFWLDAPVSQGMARLENREGAPDRFETERGRFFERVREAYQTRAESMPERYRRIDASGDLADVQTSLRNELDLLIQQRCIS